MTEEYHNVNHQNNDYLLDYDNQLNTCCTPQIDNEDDLEFKKKLKNLEKEWYQEMVEKYKNLPWYRRPNRTILFIIVSLYTLSFTVLASPLVILMFNNFCATNQVNNKSSVEKTIHVSTIAAKTIARAFATHSSTETVAIIINTTSSVMEIPKNFIKTNDNIVKSSFTFFSKRMGMNMNDAESICNGIKDSQKTISNIQSILATISGILGFFLSSKFGQLSDRYGRVFIFKVFNVINIFNSIFVIIYFQIIKKYNLILMIIFLSIGYFSGGVMTLISNSAGYVSDIEDKKTRTISISILMSVIYLALGIGPLISSFIVKITNSNIIILWVSLGLSIISTILTFTLLVESKNPKSLQLANERYNQKYVNNSRSLSSFQFFNIILSFFKPINRLWLPKTQNGSIIPRINVLTLIFVDIIQMSSCMGTMHVLVLYCILKFNWSTIQIGYYMSLLGFCKAFVLLVIAPLIHNLLVLKFNYRVNTQSVDDIDRILILISLIFIFLSILLLVITNNSYIVYLTAILQSLVGIISPIIHSAIVKFSANTESGEIFGVIAVTRHLQMLVFPVFFLRIYSFTVDKFPKLFLLLPLIGSGVSCIISYFGLITSNEMANVDIELEFEESSE